MKLAVLLLGLLCDLSAQGIPGIGGLGLAHAQAASGTCCTFVNVGTSNEPGSAMATTIASNAINVTTGNLVVIFVGSGTNSSACVSTGTPPTDNAGNTYSRANGAGSAAVGCEELWYKCNATGNAALVVTVTYTSSQQFRFITPAQYSGEATSGCLDVSNVGTGNNTAPLTAASTTTSATAMLIGGHAADNIADITAGTSYTRRTPLNGDVSIEDRAVTSTGSYTASESLSGTVNWLMVFGAFK